jgi:GNAT superfamily N-acetyltransferase
MNQDDYRYISNISLTIPETSIEVTIRNIRMDDIDKILQLQEISFASASSLVVTLNPQYSEHTWQDITGYGLFTTHDPKGDTLYGADISAHPKFQRKGIGTMLYNFRKNLAIRMNLKLIVLGGLLDINSE